MTLTPSMLTSSSTSPGNKALLPWEGTGNRAGGIQPLASDSDLHWLFQQLGITEPLEMSCLGLILPPLV